MGCSETAGGGGSGGMGGGGAGGAPECEGPEDCNDSNECTEDVCDSTGMCSNTPLGDGAICGAGACTSGECAPITSVYECSEQGIRDAIADGGGPHAFDCKGEQVVVTTDEIVINNSVILDGLDLLAVDGGSQAHRVFRVEEAATVEFRRLTVTGGNASTTDETEGGGIWNLGTLTLRNCRVSGNSVGIGSMPRGGGIFNERGDLTLVNTSVSGNTLSFPGEGGGIFNSGQLMMMASVVSDNTIAFGGSGAGIFNHRGGVTLMDSTVSGNGPALEQAANLFGGGIYNIGGVTLIRSTVSDNEADVGGGILIGGLVPGSLASIDSTISGNTAETDGGGISLGLGRADLTNTTVSENAAGRNGGGVANLGGQIRLASCTLWGNTTRGSGSAIFSFGDFASTSLRNSVVDAGCFVFGPPITSNDHNIESMGDTCGFDQPTDQVNVSADDLTLGDLADNGGPTETHALGEGSVAIDQIPAVDCVDADGEPLTTDQRGEPRPGGAMCDVGAFEVQP